MNDIEGLSFFVDVDGNLIKINNNSSIEEFSKNYVEKLGIDLKEIYSKIQSINPKYENINLNYTNLLIDILGYVLYNNRGVIPHIIAPEQNINSREVSFKQFDTISRLLIKNEQPEYLLCELFLTDGKYEKITINEIIDEINETQKKEDTHFKKLALTNRK